MDLIKSLKLTIEKVKNNSDSITLSGMMLQGRGSCIRIWYCGTYIVYIKDLFQANLLSKS